MAKKLKGEKGRLFCLTSDGEWNEGSNWEALIFSRHHNLNLTLIVDLNRLQGFGRTRDIADLEPLADKFQAFRFRTAEIDGHDLEAITAAVRQDQEGPMVVIARTTKGRGVSFMEDLFEWHYLPLSLESYQQAVEQAISSCATYSATLS